MLNEATKLSLAELKSRYAADILKIDVGEFHASEPGKDFSICIQSLSPLSHATQESCSFLTNSKYLEEAKKTNAGFILCSEPDESMLRDGNKSVTLIVCKDPYVLFARLGQFFFRQKPDVTGVSNQSFVDTTATIHESAIVYPFVFVGPGARVGARTILYSGSFVGAASTIGSDCLLYPNVVVREGCHLGDRCIVNPGAVIGGDGFGFAPFEMENVKIPQIGGVRISNDVEIGANSCIDRGALNDTRIGEQTKIDSLVMVAHNVEVGKACFLAGQCGIAGSSILGDRVVLAGQVGVAGHVKIGDRVTMLAQSGASKNVAPDQIMNGSPAKTNREHLLQMATVSKLTKQMTEKTKSRQVQNKTEEV